jgi:sec-independent protein translocase protein TatB
MFDIGWSELLLIGIVALIAIGPKELPTVLRTLGQWMAKLRRMATEFQNQFQEALREAEVADLKKHVDDITATAKGYANFDPVSEVRKEFESTQHQIENAMAQPPTASPSETGERTTPSAEPSVPLAAPAPPVQAALPEPSGAPTPAPASEPVGVDAKPDRDAKPDADIKPDAGGKPA